jgi:hypothetical protein
MAALRKFLVFGLFVTCFSVFGQSEGAKCFNKQLKVYFSCFLNQSEQTDALLNYVGEFKMVGEKRQGARLVCEYQATKWRAQFLSEGAVKTVETSEELGKFLQDSSDNNGLGAGLLLKEAYQSPRLNLFHRVGFFGVVVRDWYQEELSLGAGVFSERVDEKLEKANYSNKTKDGRVNIWGKGCRSKVEVVKD